MNDNNEIQIIEESVNEEVSHETGGEGSNKSKGPIVFLFVVIVFVVIGFFGISYLIDNGYIVIDSLNNNTVEPPKKEETVSTKKYGIWTDYMAQVQNSTFTFPMLYSEFKELIDKTDYKLSKKSSLDKELSVTYDEDDYLVYERKAKNGLTYYIKVNLQNNGSVTRKIEDSTVIGMTVEYLIIHDEKEVPYDKDITFTTKSISLGDMKSKRDLTSLFGAPNSSDELGDNEYESGKYLVNNNEYPNFYVLINNDEIVKIDMNNYLK